MVLVDAKTSKVKEDRTIDEIFVFKINFINKTIRDSRSKIPVNIIVQNKNMTITLDSEDDELKISDKSEWNLTPPISYSQRGSIIDKIKNLSGTYNGEGVCKEVDASVWDEALNQ
tara:strand:+ start:193 stop:537 length:345 start_codon:yes stop_codon:yes gene_type:complete